MEYSSIVEELEDMYFELKKLSTLDTNNSHHVKAKESQGTGNVRYNSYRES